MSSLDYILDLIKDPPTDKEWKKAERNVKEAIRSAVGPIHSQSAKLQIQRIDDKVIGVLTTTDQIVICQCNPVTYRILDRHAEQYSATECVSINVLCSEAADAVLSALLDRKGPLSALAMEGE